MAKKAKKVQDIWFNLPYLVNVKTNVGKIIFKFLKKHFPKKNKLQKIFNKNNVKISYSCMSNITSIIPAHNKPLLQPKISKYGCNCRVKNTCPLQNQCQTRNLTSRADVENEVNNEGKIYFGLAATTFKEQLGNHKKRFQPQATQQKYSVADIYTVIKRCKNTIQYCKYTITV